MGAYLRCKLTDKTQALAADDFIQTIKQNQVLMKLGKGVYMTCIKDINEVMQDDDKSQQHKKNIIAMLERDIGTINYKVSGFESVDIGGMPMHQFYQHLASVFVQLNKKFNMTYLHTSCALDMTFRFFTFTDMKAITQNGRLLSGRLIDPDAYQNKKSILELEHVASNVLQEGEVYYE